MGEKFTLRTRTGCHWMPSCDLLSRGPCRGPDGQVSHAMRAGHDQSLDAHGTTRRRHRHEARPNRVDIVEREKIGFVKLGFSPLPRAKCRPGSSTVEPSKYVLSLHFRLAAVVGKAGPFGNREPVGEIAGGESRARNTRLPAPQRPRPTRPQADRPLLDRAAPAVRVLNLFASATASMLRRAP